MTKKVLLVKTSSLGDVIHALPVISDIRSASAAERIDWVVEEPLAAVPRLHPGVSNVIPVAIRRWRGGLWRGAIRDEIAASMRTLREQSYDAVVDAQGLFKSALIALAAHGPRYGLDFHSSREPLSLFYHRTFRISWELHAVERNRLLLARTLGYDVPERCDYGIRATPQRFDWLTGGPYAVLLHATSGNYKLWREDNWIELGNVLNSAGVTCVLPWGNPRELARSKRLADRMRMAVVPPLLGLGDLGGLFAGAKCVIGVDTGLTHLAAALGVHTIGIYGATDPAATGIYGCRRAVNIGSINKSPAARDVIALLGQLD